MIDCFPTNKCASVFTVEVPHAEVLPHPTGLSRNRALSRKYSSLAEKCPPLCYSIVSYAASRIASSQGTIDDRALKHYAQGVRSLAEAVNRPATESVTLAALTLLQHDLIFFHTRAIGTHIEGIYTMIEKQGGLSYLDGTIGHVALFCDYQASVLLDRPPKYLHPSLQDARPLNAPEITNGQAFPKCKVWQLVDPRLREVIQDVCLLVEILQRACRLPTTMGDYQFFGYRRNVVENSLGFMCAEFSDSATINECLCLGMILFQSMTIGGIDTVNGIFDHLVPKFNFIVGGVYQKLGNLWATDIEMAIWLMFIGTAIPDFYKRFRNEFLQKLSRMLEASYGKDLAKAKASVRVGLSKYIWCDSMLGKRFNKTWKDIISMSPQPGIAPGDSDDDKSDDDEDRHTATGDDDSKITGFAIVASANSPQEEPHFSGKGKEREGGQSRST
jgi:Fungal specific transcription factor domain